ncbi:hypothetical protein QMK19_24540 [Streptomyces sp. H10-C2]|nr:MULTISPECIES: hypothetical protein [unclassified Streptomyces]MDJ0343077.1 hypothetical protein [Streptomyces sp. PH10-H1]MDJ0372743.1 hypothetical protein [Streptomyces sp. H10-C2]
MLSAEPSDGRLRRGFEKALSAAPLEPASPSRVKVVRDLMRDGRRLG